MDALLSRKPPTWLEKFFHDPLGTLAKTIHHHRQSTLLPPTPLTPPIRLICISDTHNTLPPLPPGDILIHAGDLTADGSHSEIQPVLDYLAAQPHPHKIVIAGNHEILLDPNHPDAKTESKIRQRHALNWHDIHYLQDSELVLRLAGGRSLKIYGSPWTRQRGNWAFQYRRHEDKWSGSVPDDVDVLVTHMPPFGHLDIDDWGDEWLLEEVRRVKPKVHVFGHFHGGRGMEGVVWDGFEEAFEDVLRRKGWGVVVLGLVRMCWFWLLGLMCGRKEVETVMINAAMMAGSCRDPFRDDVVLQAQIVDI